MKIADLERASGVHRSTIHHYLNVGLLPAPWATGPKLHLFGPDHVSRLKEIRHLRADGWGLARIRTHLAGGRRLEARPAQVREEPHSDGTRRRIVERATPLFAERGYDGVRLSEVARELGIGKATIYRYFPNKQALFVDCVEKVRFTLIPKEACDMNDGRESFAEQGRRRAARVLANFAAFRTLSNLLGSVAHGPDPELARRARAELHRMVTNAEPLLRRMMEARQIRPVDPELLAYMLWFSLMGAGERLLLDGDFTQGEVLEAYLEFVTQGIGGPPAQP